MIDTLELRLHNCNKTKPDLNSKSGLSYTSPFNRELYLKLLELDNKYIERTIIDKENKILETDLVESQFKRKSHNNIAILNHTKVTKKSYDKTEIYTPLVRGSIQSSSSDYRLLYSFSHDADSIKLIFSIPKYIYGHSVAQFLPNINSERYQKNLFTIHQFKKQTEFIHARLIEIIYTLFYDLSYMFNMNISNFDFRDVEISRLDLCYNQIFYSKNMALDYLNNQKKIIKSRIKKNTKFSDYETSFAYRHANDGFYFKIYHKGSEFKKQGDSDFKRLLQHNKKYFDTNPHLYKELKQIFRNNFKQTAINLKDRVEDLIFQYYETYINTNDHQKYISELEQYFPFKLSHILKFADKTLRYEMSFTRTYMSTLYKKEYFRKQCKHWQQLKDSYTKIKMYDKKLGICQVSAKKYFREKNITKDMRNEYKVYDRSTNKKHEFFLFTSKALQRHEQQRTSIENLETDYKRNRGINEQKQATLSKEFLTIMFDRFYKEIQLFQINEIEDNLTSIERIKEYNKKVKQNINSYNKLFGPNAHKKLSNKEKAKKGFIEARESRFKLILDKLDEKKSIDEICDELNLQKTARYSLKKQLAKFNIYANSVKTKFSFDSITTDFKPYYEQFFLDNKFKSKLFCNPFLVDFDAIRSEYHYDYMKNHNYLKPKITLNATL